VTARGERYESEHPGTLGGYRKGGIRIYGRLNCPSALRAIANGNYMRHRVFFADEITALSAGFRPCAKCLPKLYAEWKLSPSEWQKKKRHAIDFADYIHEQGNLPDFKSMRASRSRARSRTCQIVTKRTFRCAPEAVVDKPPESGHSAPRPGRTQQAGSPTPEIGHLSWRHKCFERYCFELRLFNQLLRCSF
jgi:hypothetical protein